MDSIRVLFFPVGGAPEEREIDRGLTAQQALVEGDIEVVSVGRGLLVTCNDEGRIREMPFNRHVPGRGCDIPIFGPFFLTRLVVDDNGSVTDADIAWAKGAFWRLEPESEDGDD